MRAFVLEQVTVAAAPDPQCWRCYGRKRRLGAQLVLRRHVRAVPIEGRGQGIRPREICDIPFDLGCAAEHFAKEAPVVALQQLLGDIDELEKQHIPRLLALRDRDVSTRCGMADGQCNEMVDAIGPKRGKRQATAAPQSCPTT